MNNREGDIREIPFNREFQLVTERVKRSEGQDLLEEFYTVVNIGDRIVKSNGRIEFFANQPIWVKTTPKVFPIGFSPSSHQWVFDLRWLSLDIPRQMNLGLLRNRFCLFVSYMMNTPTGEINSVFYAVGFPTRLSKNEVVRSVFFSKFRMIYPELQIGKPGRLILPYNLDILQSCLKGRLAIKDFKLD